MSIMTYRPTDVPPQRRLIAEHHQRASLNLRWLAMTCVTVSSQKAMLWQMFPFSNLIQNSAQHLNWKIENSHLIFQKYVFETLDKNYIWYSHTKQSPCDPEKMKVYSWQMLQQTKNYTITRISEVYLFLSFQFSSNLSCIWYCDKPK